MTVPRKKAPLTKKAMLPGQKIHPCPLCGGAAGFDEDNHIGDDDDEDFVEDDDDEAPPWPYCYTREHFYYAGEWPQTYENELDKLNTYAPRDAPRLTAIRLWNDMCAHYEKPALATRLPVRKKQQESKMSDLMYTVKNAAHRTKRAAVRGAKVATSVRAQQILMAQIQKRLGDKFPSDLYATPIGKALLDGAACYLVMVLAETFPDLPAAELVNEAAELAIEGIARDGMAPLLAVGGQLFQDVADSVKREGLKLKK